MQITGRSLVKLERVVAHALEGVQLRIGSHPDPGNYEDEIAELEADKAYIEKLQQRVERAIQKESQK
jgi:hypothetical protein